MSDSSACLVLKVPSEAASSTGPRAPGVGRGEVARQPGRELSREGTLQAISPEAAVMADTGPAGAENGADVIRVRDLRAPLALLSAAWLCLGPGARGARFQAQPSRLPRGLCCRLLSASHSLERSLQGPVRCSVCKISSPKLYFWSF